jgi:hypothetical protein
MQLRLWSAAIAISIFASAVGVKPSRAECTFAWACLDKKSTTSNVDFQQMISSSKQTTYATTKDLYYVDLKIKCDAPGLVNFARRYVERAWNIGLARQDRDLALTVEIEKILGGGQAPVSMATYPIVQVKRDAAGNTDISGCQDYIATNLPFDAKLRLKFKLLQSKQTRIADSTYAAFRIFARFVGFVVGTGPQGVALAASAASISSKVSESKTDIDQIASSFDELQTSKPQLVLDTNTNSLTVRVDDSSSFTIERIGKRSVFLSFAGDAVQNTGAAFDGIIAQNTSLNLTSYLDQKAPAWKSLLPSTDQKNAVEGCTNIRNALRAVFTEEERAVLLARLISDFGEATIRNFKEPCLHASERSKLRAFGVTDPLPAAGEPEHKPPEDARPEDRDNRDRIRWGVIERFLGEFGGALAKMPTAATTDRVARLKVYFDDRIATETFDAPELLTTSNGAQRESLANVLASWPYGNGIRYGCFMRPPKILSAKFSGQMLIELDSEGTSPKLFNLVVGFTDRETTDIDKLVIGNLLIERAMTGLLEEVKKNFKDGCGDRADRWKPWDRRLTAERSSAVRFAEIE